MENTHLFKEMLQKVSAKSSMLESFFSHNYELEEITFSFYKE